MGRMSTISVAIAMGAALLSAPARAERESAFGPGEQSTYKVKYLGVTAGSAQITVGTEITQYGQTVIPIVTTARTQSLVDLYPIRDKFVTYWDFTQERCIGSDLFADENKVKRRQRVKVDHANGKATVMKQKEGGDEQVATLDVAPGVHDIASATFALRNMPLTQGAVFELPVFTGKKTFTLRATVEGKEKLSTPLGTKEVYKVRVQTGFGGKFESKRDMYAFMTTDGSHVPVRIEAEFVLGTITAEISEYKTGRRYAVRDELPQSEGSGGG